MHFDKYIISFCPGSSGRFIHAILHNLILSSDTVLEFNKNNDAHFDLPLSGLAENINGQDVFDIVEFTNQSVNVLRTHTFPEIDTINKRFGNNVGIIVISLTTQDLCEVIFNSHLKNKDTILTQIRLNALSRLKEKAWAKFINPELGNQDNILILEYRKLFEENDNSYVAIQLLEQFTGVKATPNLIKTYRNYACGREKLLKTHLPWLSELQRNLDK